MRDTVELTDQEFGLLCELLEKAKDEAYLESEQARIDNLHRELVNQWSVDE